MTQITSDTALKRLTQDPEWMAIEELISTQVSDLLDLRNVEQTLSPEEMKIEIRARQLAVSKLVDFYNTNRFSQRKSEEVAVSFE